MSKQPETNFSVVFKKLGEFKGSDEATEIAAVAEEAEEIQELRRIIEETNSADCVAFSTT